MRDRLHDFMLNPVAKTTKLSQDRSLRVKLIRTQTSVGRFPAGTHKPGLTSNRDANAAQSKLRIMSSWSAPQTSQSRTGRGESSIFLLEGKPDCINYSECYCNLIGILVRAMRFGKHMEIRPLDSPCLRS